MAPPWLRACTLNSGEGDEKFKFFLSKSLEYFLLLLFLISVFISLIFIWGLKDLLCNIIFFRLDKLTHDPVDEQTVFEVRLSTVIIAAHRSRRCGYPHLYWANVEVLEEDQCIASRKQSHIVDCCGQ